MARAATALLAVVAVAACGHRGGPADNADPSATSTTLPPPVTVRIGFLGATTATGATLGRTVENAERLAVSQFIGEHPGLDVIVDVGATGGTAAGAVEAARHLVADRVVAVIGPQTRPEVRAALPVLSAAGIPSVTATATATDLAESGWTSFFRALADDQQQGVDEATELVTSQRVTSLAVLSGTDGAEVTRAAWAASTATQLGADVAVSASVTTPVEVAGVARRIVGSGVGGVYAADVPSVTVDLIRDLDDDGYEGVVLIASDSPASGLGIIGATADGVYTATPTDDPAAAAASGGAALVFEDAYRAAFGATPPVSAAEAYDATDAVLAAVASGATTGPTIDAYLLNHTSVGVSASLSFDSDGDQVDPPVFVSRIRNGVPAQVATVAAPADG